MKIIFHPLARDEANEAAMYIRDKSSPETALRWREGLMEAVYSLTKLPHRCGYARENGYVRKRELRQLLYKSHRVIYTVIDDEVHILRVRHQRQDELGEL